MKGSGATILLILGLNFTSVGIASDFKNGVCDNDGFLKCVGATKASCESSYSRAEKDCLEKHPIDTDAENEELYNLARKYGECTTAGFINGLNIADNKFEICGKHLEPMFDEYRKNTEQELKLNEERLRKLEEIQYK